ncbi:MAG: pitrilysin family protein [Synechococcales bacterium]|nr:pitrilysin family protein [Synechococcales bacterium]
MGVWLWLGIPGLAEATPLSTSSTTSTSSTSTRSTQAPPSASVRSIQPYLDRVLQNVTEFTLENGAKFIVLERHQAPVVSFLTYADVGGADEETGKTGISHFLEHLAFKGTQRIGTADYAQEKILFQEEDRLWAEIQQAQKAGDSQAVKSLQAQFDQVEAQAGLLVEQNEFSQIVDQAGGVGLNANTSAEATRYFFSFPANQLELWMSLESERFLEPVFREFYKEKAVILEERRLRTDNSPIGKLVEEFLLTAFTKHPYRNPVVGFEQDIRNLSRQDLYDFFQKHYYAANLTFAIVGDVDPAEVKRMAQIYFGRFPKRTKEIPQLPVEPPQTAPREVKVEFPSQPIYLEGYHRPALKDPDNVVYDAIASLLSDGRTSRLYKSLVVDQRIALSVEGFNGFPGFKYPNLIMFYALTAPGKTIEAVQTALQAEIERLKQEPVSQVDLDRIKTQARAALLRSLRSNMGMAQALLEYEVKMGSWRNLFQQVDAIAAITPGDIQRVARKTFTPENRTIGRLLPKPTS